jgi:hypothetical protein
MLALKVNMLALKVNMLALHVPEGSDLTLLLVLVQLLAHRVPVVQLGADVRELVQA